MKIAWTGVELRDMRMAACKDIANIRKETVNAVARALSFTCDACKAVRNCECAYDSYNVDGDCLRDK